MSDARVVYVSATGATEVANLAYAERLGLWGQGTAFANRDSFVTSIKHGGVAAMEVISRDMKAMGLYTARALSYDGVRVDILEHELTPEQIKIYDTYSEAYAVIHQNIMKAMEACNITGADGSTLNNNTRSAAMSTFEGNKQRFFNHLLTAMKCPSLIRSIKEDLDNGHAPVIQIVSTSEALLNRRLEAIPKSEWQDLNIDVTPREYVMDYLNHAFPVQLNELYQDDNDNTRSRPVYDSQNNPVLNQEAVAMRDVLITKLASLPSVQAALDQIIHYFGHDTVAEVTGRSVRLIRQDGALMVNKRSTSANLAETQAFMDDQKQILVFSDAGGTGRSYHADLDCLNQRQRVHYLLEPGWRADNAIQGLGRTNRTNQASAPIFRPVATNVKGEKRFLSTIARRLDTLGAMTKGQRETGGQGMFRPEDNLESDDARAALRALFLQILKDKIADCSYEDFKDQTGLELKNENGEETFPPTARFLNRLLAMPIAMQNMLYERFEHILHGYIEELKESGQYNIGIETITAESVSIMDSNEVYCHSETNAKAWCWNVERKDKLYPLSIDQALSEHVGTFVINEQSGMAALKVQAVASTCIDTGASLERVRLIRPTSSQHLSILELKKSSWIECSKEAWQRAWQNQLDSLPEYETRQFMMVTGILLPIWQSIGGSDVKIYRLKTDDGQVLLGRKLESKDIASFRKSMGLDTEQLSPEQILEAVQNGESYALANDLRIKQSRIMYENRIEIVTQGGSILDQLVSLGCFAEIIQYQRRVFVPTGDNSRDVLKNILAEYPLS